MKKLNLSIKNVSAHPAFTALGSALAIALPMISDNINVMTLGGCAVLFVLGCLAGIKKDPNRFKVSKHLGKGPKRERIWH